MKTIHQQQFAKPLPPNGSDASHPRMDRSTTSGQRDSHFRPDIEGLRAVAILLVVLFHAGVPLSPGGFVGVDVFYVISGYLITGLLVREVESSGRISLSNFYARRIRRLLPASAAMVLVVVLAGYLLLSPLERELQTRAAFAAAAYVSNIWFQRQASDYFAPDSGQNPFLHTWSLSVEEQFYLFWPVVIAVTYRLFRSRKILGAVMLGLSFVSLGLCLWLARHNTPAAFFSSPARAWEFGVGGAASLLRRSPLHERWIANTAAGVIGLLVVLVSAVFITRSTPFPGTITLAPVLGTALVLVSCASDARRGVGRILRLPVMQWLGKRSYSWYLWHWPVLVFAVALIPSLTLIQRVALAVMSLGIAAVSHAYLENPIRFSPYLAMRPLTTLMLGAAITTVSVGTSRMAKRGAKAAADAPMQRAIVEASDGPEGFTRSRCLLDFATERLLPCAFGDTAATTTIALFGDSHAAQWFTALDTIASENRWRFEVFTKQGCPSTLVTVPLWTFNRAYPECTRWRAAALQRILELHPALVIVANSDAHVTWPDRKVIRLTPEQWREGSRRTFSILDSAGIATVALRDTPGFHIDVLRCLSRALGHGRPATECAASRTDVVREDVYSAVKKAAAGLSHVSTLDLTDLFCDADRCPLMRDDVIMFRDGGHVSFRYARSLASKVAVKLTPLATRRKASSKLVAVAAP